jgi:hypothetical protein
MCKQVTDCFKLSNMALHRNNWRYPPGPDMPVTRSVRGAAGQHQRESEARQGAAVPEPAT